MEILYSNILPLESGDNQETNLDCFIKQISVAERVDIAVGYISLAALDELDRLMYSHHNIQYVCLVIGMYFAEGMPEKTYHAAIKINRKWQQDKVGEIRIVKPFKYHGKVYCFYKNGTPFSAIIGSGNLSMIKLEANNRRQYELSVCITEREIVEEVAQHVNELKKPICSEIISTIQDLPLLREVNTALNGIELVTPIPQSTVDFYRELEADITFSLKLKVPSYSERFMDDGRHFTKSNINVCYAAPRSKRKPRDWYEAQLTVGADIYRMHGYPQRNKPFFVITDDGYWFKAHTTSDNNKQFSAVGDELIMGRWLKGRLAAAGLVEPVNNTAEDVDREGMITKEMLQEYGCDRLLFKKTGRTAIDEEGNSLDVWFLSFIGNSEK